MLIEMQFNLPLPKAPTAFVKRQQGLISISAGLQRFLKPSYWKLESAIPADNFEKYNTKHSWNNGRSCALKSYYLYGNTRTICVNTAINTRYASWYQSKYRISLADNSKIVRPQDTIIIRSIFHYITIEIILLFLKLTLIQDFGHAHSK